MLRLTLILALAFLALAGAAWRAHQPTSAGQPLYGDASCDGLVNSIDAAIILQLSAGLLPSVGCPANADVNADGQTNSLDSALILQYVAGLITHLGPISGITPTPLTPTRTSTRTNTPPPNATPTPPPVSTATTTPPPGSTPVQYPEIYYYPTFWWHDTEITLQAGTRIHVDAYGSVIYDNHHLTGVSPGGDGSPTGWGNCQDHSLVGWVGDVRPGPNADPTLANVICLGSQFDGAVPTSGHFYISINDRGAFANNVGQWYVTVTVY